jgi:hypothetical protein
MNYDPKDVDLAWMAGVLEMTNEGAVIVYPSTGLIYKLSHSNRTLMLINPAKLDDPECRKLHERTAIVAEFFHYTVGEAGYDT